MRFLHLKYLVFCGLYWCTQVLCAQHNTLSNYRKTTVKATNDTIFLDSLSIIPSSFILRDLDSSDYEINFLKSYIIIKNPLLQDSIQIQYRVFPYNLAIDFKHRDSTQNNKGQTINPYQSYGVKEINYADLFSDNQLQKNGNISRGVNFGNNRDLSVSSQLNLQLAGKIQDIDIVAAISDNNIPIQPDGNTQQLQDFDRVFIQFSKNNHQLVAGDFPFVEQEDVFLKLNKKAQGLGYKGEFKHKNQTIKTELNGALSRGQFARNSFFGTEGNQGPYQMIGAENERFIIVLSGTERVYIDGKLLKRGMENDYVINYNTGEITFTSKQIITKDKRIVFEFQYTARNYSRTLVYSSTEIDWNNKTQLRINLFSEQDMKFQSINQLLNPADIQLMADVGDSLHLAFKPSIVVADSSTNNAVLYEKRDTLVNGTLYTYYKASSTENAIYNITFSNVGLGNGTYQLVPSNANGREFAWTAPSNGKNTGSYEPVVRLVTPKQQQMATFTLQHQFKPKQKLFIETALSNNNINLFSDKDKSDNQGIAVNAKLETEKDLRNDWKMISKQSYQQVSNRFTEVERFRTVEFQRDWNLTNKPEKTEHWITLNHQFLKNNKEKISIENMLLNRGSDYTGFKNRASFNTSLGVGNEILGNVSYLSSSGSVFSSTFLKHNVRFNQKIKNFNMALWQEQEQNIARLVQLDSLLPTSINFRILGSGAGYDHEKWSTFLSYEYRTDDLPLNNQLTRNTNAHNYALDFSNKSKINKLSLKSTYRVMNVIDSILRGQVNENTLLNRLDFRNNWWKGFIAATTFYEMGTGNELKRTFSYVEVLAGQGTHTWIDYNADGKQQINEFEIAQFQDQANFVRVFLPTNEFVSTFSNQLNHSLNITPSKILNRDNNWKKFITRFSNQTTINLNEKTLKTNEGIFTIPFTNNFTDANLISVNSNQRNTLYFNRSNPKFGVNYTWGKNTSKNILVNGLEGRLLQQNITEIRWNFYKQYSLQLKLEKQKKQRSSELFANNEFLIQSYIIEPTISYQPNPNFRLNLNVSYKQKNNADVFGGQATTYQKIGSDVTFAAVGKGRLNVQMDYIQTTFDVKNQSNTNSPIQFEMLEGLQIGQNFTWQIRYQQSFQNNLQANISYEGRKSQTAPTIHTASVQVQLLF